MKHHLNLRKACRRSLFCFVILVLLDGSQPLLAGDVPPTDVFPEKNPLQWEITLSLSGGYDSNPSQLGDDLPLPPELEQKDSAFVEAEVFGKFTYDFAKPGSGITDQLRMSYDFVADVYTDISGNDQNIHTLVAAYKRSLCPTVIGELRLTDIFVQSDGDSLYNLFQVRPTLLIDESKIFNFLRSLELAYTFSTYKFFPAGASLHDQDRHSLNLNQAFSLSKAYGTQLDIAYVHAWNQALGDDYDFEQDSVVILLQTNFGPERPEGEPKRFLQKLSGSAKVKYNFDRYSNLNSKAAFLKRRSDDYNQFIAVLTYAVNDHFTVNASYTYAHDDSNIPVYRYHQHTVLAGMSLTF